MPQVWLVLGSPILRNWRDSLKERHWGCNSSPSLGEGRFKGLAERVEVIASDFSVIG